jgi:alkylation response protein AidB-like acyl-CoA dehydrogenase
MRQRIASVFIEHTLLDLIRLRTLSARLKGQQPGPEASVRKILADEHGQHVMALARDLIGAEAMLAPTDRRGFGPEPAGGLLNPGWYHGYLFSQALTIGGGTGDVQRNIVGERVLGLPHDADVTIGMSWSETQRADRVAMV